MKKSILVILAVATLIASLAHAAIYRGAPGAICKGKTFADRMAIDFTNGYAKNASTYNIDIICPINFSDFNFWKELHIETWAQSSATSHVFKCRAVFRTFFTLYTYYVYAGGRDDTMDWYNYLFQYRYKDAEHFVECTIPPQAKIKKIYWIEN